MLQTQSNKLPLSMQTKSIPTPSIIQQNAIVTHEIPQIVQQPLQDKDKQHAISHLPQLSAYLLSTELRDCLRLLDELMSMEICSAFLEAVDWKMLGLPNYPSIIKRPMDLGTIKKNLLKKPENGRSVAYEDAYDFAEDVRLVWKNAKQFNTPGSQIYVNAETLSLKFEKKFQRIKKVMNSRKKYETSNNKRNARKIETSREDRLLFTKLVKQLNSEQLGMVVHMIDDKAPQALNDMAGEEDLEIEVYFIDKQTLVQLIRLCENAIKSTAQNKLRTQK